MISVIIPVYNGEGYIQESIESLLNQTEKDFELIIINDGSYDNTEKIIQQFTDERIKYYKKENGGTASAFNMGLDVANGEYIAWQAADDISLPTRLEKLKHGFFSSKVGIVHSDMLLIQNNSPVAYWQSQNFDSAKRLRFFLKIGTPFNGGNMMFRSSIIGNHRFDPKYKIGEDTEFLFRISDKSISVHIPEPLYLYRQHGANISKQQDYTILHLHVQDFINNHSLEELFPELEWSDSFKNDSSAIAYALLALFLFKRNMNTDAELYFNTAIKWNNLSEQGFGFVKGIGHIILGDFSQAIYEFSKLAKNHIVDNYLGEAYAYSGDLASAFICFNNALQYAPYYEEPLDNLKAIGTKQNYTMIDRSWKKYLI